MREPQDHRAPLQQGEMLIFTRPDGKREDCEVLFQGGVPGCVVVRFLKNGVPTSHDGQTVPIKQLDRAYCPRCNIIKRAEGGHLCGDCGEDI